MPEVSIDLNMVRVTNDDFVKKSRSLCTKASRNNSKTCFYCRNYKN